MARSMLPLILSLAMLFTSIGVASARGAAPAVDQVVICSGHGVSVLFLDADGAPTQAPQLCPDCVVHLVGPFPGGMDIALGSAPRQMSLQARVTSQNVRPHRSPTSPRAPPVSSI
ncbi:hypothetical protein [uncultured Tateyamaria sp.]|uniref:hypothetical protein n=1 Tax=Tateyamaria sp. 1078 TaxID=3417464 RepID=UPI002625F1EA|nr:hypothetical protein [uncultured Tateyamaria sp.]